MKNFINYTFILIFIVFYSCSKPKPSPPPPNPIGLYIGGFDYNGHKDVIVHNTSPDSLFVAFNYEGYYYQDTSSNTLLDTNYIQPYDSYTFNSFTVGWMPCSIVCYFDEVMNDQNIYWDTIFLATSDTTYIYTP